MNRNLNVETKLAKLQILEFGRNRIITLQRSSKLDRTKKLTFFKINHSKP